MAKALFITRTDLIKNSIINGSIDTDKFIPFVKIAQDLHIANYLGTDLYNKLQSDIIANNLTGDYLTLVNSYVKDCLIHYALSDYIPFASYEIKNGGFVKNTPENSQPPTESEVNRLSEKHRSIAQFYTRRMIDYIVYNQNKFPEYNTNTNGDLNPDRDVNTVGWVL